MSAMVRLAMSAALLCAPIPAQAAATVFVGATVIDGTGAAPIPDGVVVVRDGRIVAVGPRARVTIPADAQRVEVAGKTIMPGLVNAHVHVRASVPGSTAPAEVQLRDQLALYARYGVTTAYSLGDDGVEDIKLRNVLRAAPTDTRPPVARFYVAGLLNPADPAQARAAASEVAKSGFDMAKIRLQGPPEASIRKAYPALIAQAHAEGMRVAVHILTAQEARDVIDAGADVLAHSVRDRDAPADLIASMKAKGVGYIPTLTREVAQYVYESPPFFLSDPFFAKEAAYRAPLAPLLTPERQAEYRLPPAQAGKAMLAQAKRNLKILFDAGIPIAMGSDTGSYVGRWQGYFEHLELELMVEAGLTPMQVLTIATSGAAKVMQIDSDVGSLAPGKFADLLVLGADPLADIRNTKTLEQVWIGGRRVE